MAPIRLPAPPPPPPAPPPPAPTPIFTPPPTPTPTAPALTNFATVMLALEVLNNPFFASPLLAAASDQLALIEAEQESLAQAALAAGLGTNPNIDAALATGLGTNINIVV